MVETRNLLIWLTDENILKRSVMSYHTCYISLSPLTKGETDK